MYQRVLKFCFAHFRYDYEKFDDNLRHLTNTSIQHKSIKKLTMEELKIYTEAMDSTLGSSDFSKYELITLFDYLEHIGKDTKKLWRE